VDCVGRKGVLYEHRIIDLSNKPRVFLDKYASVRRGNAQVPLLEHGENLVIESEDLVKYISQNIGTSGRLATAPFENTCVTLDHGDCMDKMYPIRILEIRERIDQFLNAWHIVVDDYYDVLTASSDPEVQSRLTSFSSVSKGLK
jgi:hypothetical protein